MGVVDSIRHAWNVFTNGVRYGTVDSGHYSDGPGYSYRPDRHVLNYGSTKTILGGIQTRISIDAGSIEIKHIRLNEVGDYQDTIKSSLNDCLTIEANIDQSAVAFRRDLIRTMLDEGVVAVVPVDSDFDPMDTGSYKINTLRVGRILEWRAKKVRVRLWNENTGYHQDVWVPKSMCAIIENPLYDVMNEPNSILQRLIRKLSILDQIDEQAGSGKLDLIIQLPYVIKNQTRQEQADKRRKDIEMQLRGSKYGIAYTDGSERITQLNRPAENNMLKHVEYLTAMLYGQLGLTPGTINGTATEDEMISYDNRTIKPILTTIVEELTRKFITKTGRTQGQSIGYFIDPFKNASVASLAELADKFTRNEILTSNEVRSRLGVRPSSDPRADKLVNANISQAKQGGDEEPTPPMELKQVRDEKQGGSVKPQNISLMLEELKSSKHTESEGQNGSQTRT